MEKMRGCEKRCFPIKTVKNVVNFFKYQLTGKSEPNLAILSIVVGALENGLCNNRILPNRADQKPLAGEFPQVEIGTINLLYERFEALVRGNVDLSSHLDKYATRELIKRTSDVVWNSLSRSFYKDKAHLQSLYSFLTGNKLDCFGLALAVVAACQLLGLEDVHLALSEDHAWVVFGENGEQTAEVTWHGKENEDKRGQPITVDSAHKSWLYVNNHPVICNRYMEVAALVSAINPHINSTTDSYELGCLQQELLWMLYDLGHLSRYPMALGNLGDLEEIQPTSARPSAVTLFNEAIEANKLYYGNLHVYPYTYLAGYYYRNQQYKDALRVWAEAANVIRNYNYTKSDEEIYKEFLEIGNEFIPNVIKMATMGSAMTTLVEPKQSDSLRHAEAWTLSCVSLLQDPECFAYLLQFYDGICEWEQGSATPVLHIGWAQNLAFCLSKFDASVRSSLNIEVSKNGDEEDDKTPELITKEQSEQKFFSPKVSEDSFITTLESKFGYESNNDVNPNIAALTAACSESILNPDYLLGTSDDALFADSADFYDILSNRSNGTPFLGLTVDSMMAASSPTCSTHSSSEVSSTVSLVSSQPKVRLQSHKMCGLKELLMAEGKLNTSAIKLQLTAQSEVEVSHRRKPGHEFDYTSFGGTRKRPRWH